MEGEYDAIIIGAGIGGLVCGNYLAKAGLKVLIIEQHNKVGGYCTSFKRGHFIFDAGVHELTHCGEEEILGKIIRELKVDKRVCIKRFQDGDTIITDKCKIIINDEYLDTRRQLEYYFPQEKNNIRAFFELFKHPIFFSLYNRLKNRSFKELLDEYFVDEGLKRFWYTMCCSFGLAPSKLAAMAAFSVCRSLIMYSGYYPLEGMQVFSNTFLDTFREFGGEIILSQKATKIDINNGKVVSVTLANGARLFTKHVVATSDPIQTYFSLIGSEYLEGDFIDKINSVVPFPSAFIVFLGLNKTLKKDIRERLSIVFYPDSLIESRYDVREHFNLDLKDMVIVPSSIIDSSVVSESKKGESIYLFKIVPYMNKEYWDKNKFLLAEKMINNAGSLIPSLGKYVVHQEIATPYTLYKYTLNHQGALKGWGAGFSTTGLKMRNLSSNIMGLFIAGHWAPSPVGNGGISMAAYSGFQTAKKIKDKLQEV